MLLFIAIVGEFLEVPLREEYLLVAKSNVVNLRDIQKIKLKIERL